MDWIVTTSVHVSAIHAPAGVALSNTHEKRQLDSPTPSFMWEGPTGSTPPDDSEATALSAMLVHPLQSESFAPVHPDGQQPSPLTHPTALPTQAPPLHTSPVVHALLS